MKVKELIEILLDQDTEREVVLSKDSEGNAYSPAYGEISTQYLYVPDSPWGGELWSAEDDEHEDCDHDDDDEDCIPEPPDGAIPCIVLWPTN